MWALFLLLSSLNGQILLDKYLLPSIVNFEAKHISRFLFITPRLPNPSRSHRKPNPCLGLRETLREISKMWEVKNGGDKEWGSRKYEEKTDDRIMLS